VTNRVRTSALLLVVSAVAGCGNSEDSATTAAKSPPTVATDSPAEAEVRAALTEFYDALGRGDGERVCATFTETNQREMGGSDGPPEERLARCAAEVEREFKGLPTLPFSEIRVTGNEANVDIPGSPSTGEGGNAQLIRLGGVWRVDAY
jgi:hypothetical protein